MFNFLVTQDFSWNLWNWIEFQSLRDGSRPNGRDIAGASWPSLSATTNKSESTINYHQMLLISPLKGLFTIFLFSVRSHILNGNGVWYWWFCPEGPINAPNSRFLGSYFVPRDLDSRRHMGPRLTAQGTLTHGAGDLDSQRHGKSMAPRVKVPCAAS